MDFRFQNQHRNFQSNFDQDWQNNSSSVRNPWNMRNGIRRPVRPAMRRRNGVNEMRNSLRRATHEMFEAYDDFDDAKVDVQNAKLRLEDVKNEVIQVKTGLQNSMVKLERLVSNFQSPRTLNSLNARDRAVFQRELENVSHDIEEARIRFRDEGELEDDGSARQYVAGPNRGTNPAVNSAKRMRPDLTEAGPSVNNDEDKNDKSEGFSSCSVCMENAVNAVLYTCGHMCMCFSCARKLLRRRGDNRRCPMCRAVIRDIIKIYRS